MFDDRMHMVSATTASDKRGGRTTTRHLLTLTLLLLVGMPVGWSDTPPTTTLDAAPAAEATAESATSGAVEPFAFIHISDTHFGPHQASAPPPQRLRGEPAINWLASATLEPQRFPGMTQPSPRPAFALLTGDIFEYGVIDDTFALFERAFRSIPYPIYLTTGNHDNTWGAIYPLMRARHGDENYSFDRFGCHFIVLSSASPQEPLPTFDGKTRAWLQRDLAAQRRDTPIFVAFHHPPYGGEFANPIEADTFIDLLRDYNVVLLLYGHGHGVAHRTIDGIDGVMGGSTFGKNAGYGLVTARDDKLHVMYRYHRPNQAPNQSTLERGWRRLLEKPITRTAPTRLFTIESPTQDAVLPRSGFTIKTRFAEGYDPLELVGTISIDGRGVPHDPSPNPSGEWRVKPRGLAPGWHVLSMRVLCKRDGASDLRTLIFQIDADRERVAWRRAVPAGIKAAPLVVGDTLYVAGTDGVVYAFDRASGAPRWTFSTKGEILGGPAWTGRLLVFGSGDGHVYGLQPNGEQAWKTAIGTAVYSPPALYADVAYIGDNEGRLHAIDVKHGTLLWTFRRAGFAIESQPTVTDALVIFGAWDGHLYAVHRATGELAWKTLGPKSSEGGAARYYAPADCGPLVANETLLVCDRGYYLGSYDLSGTTINSKLAEKVTAIVAATTRTTRQPPLHRTTETPTPPGSATGAVGSVTDDVIVRFTDNRVARLGTDGTVRWQTQVSAGRFPVPPTVRGETVLVCSNTGQLTTLDANTGSAKSVFQCTPGYYVMAAVAATDDVAYVCGMDGSITAVRYE